MIVTRVAGAKENHAWMRLPPQRRQPSESAMFALHGRRMRPALVISHCKEGDSRFAGSFAGERANPILLRVGVSGSKCEPISSSASILAASSPRVVGLDRIVALLPYYPTSTTALPDLDAAEDDLLR